MRKPYLDNIKWVTVVLVVLYHVVYMYNGVETFGVVGPFQPVQVQDAYQYIVYPWFMLLLFVVSGMCARYSLEHQSVRTFIRARTRKYLVPSTLGLLAVGWVLGYYNMQLAGAFEPLQSVPKAVLWVIMALSGCGPLWYIQMLWVFSVLLVLFRKLEKDRLYHACAKTPVWLLAAFALPIWGAAQVLNADIVVYRFGIYGLGFLLGYLAFSHEEVMDRLAKHWRLFTAAAVVCGAVFTGLFWGKPYAEHVVLDTFLCNLYAWLGTLGVLAFMRRWGNVQNQFTDFMRRKSWGLYLFHYLPLAACAYYLAKYAPGTPPVLCYLAVAAAAFGGAFVLYEIASRIPLIRWLTCGIGGNNHVGR